MNAIFGGSPGDGASLGNLLGGGGGGGSLSGMLGSLLGGGAGGGAGGGSLSGLLGGLFGGGGQTLTATQAAAINLPASAAGGAGGLAALGPGIAALASNPFTWILAAGLIGESNDWWRDPDGYKRSNGGMLVGPTPGADPNLLFDVPAFTSGFSPTGIARRTDRDKASATINQFRAIDDKITTLAQALGLNVNLSQATFDGVGEDGVFGTSGTFLGVGGKTSNLGAQHDMFARQIVKAIANQNGMGGALSSYGITSASTADDIVSILERELGVQEDIASAAQEQIKVIGDFGGAIHTVTQDLRGVFEKFPGLRATGGLTSEQAADSLMARGVELSGLGSGGPLMNAARRMQIRSITQSQIDTFRAKRTFAADNGLDAPDIPFDAFRNNARVGGRGRSGETDLRILQRLDEIANNTRTSAGAQNRTSVLGSVIVGTT